MAEYTSIVDVKNGVSKPFQPFPQPELHKNHFTRSIVVLTLDTASGGKRASGVDGINF